MLTYSSYMPAVRAQERISSPNAWPSFEQYVANVVQRLEWCWNEARPFPAASFCPLSARPQKQLLRISTEHLPALPVPQWIQEQQDWWHAYERAPQDIVPAPEQRQPRRVGWLERQVDKILAWQEQRRAFKAEKWAR